MFNKLNKLWRKRNEGETESTSTASRRNTTSMINQIFKEDCLKTLERMEDQSIDLVITSPPYNMNLRISAGKDGKGRYHSRQIVKEISTKYEKFKDNLPIEEYYDFHSKVLQELLRVSDLVFYNIQIVTGSKRSLFKMIGEFSDYLKDIVIWDKGHAQPAMQKQVLNRRYELILIFENDYPISRQFRKRGHFDRGTLDDIWQIKRERSVHSSNTAVFPEELVETILKNFSKTGDTVYDPFIGTGTTAVVAQKMNRNYIGSEKYQKYFDISQKRLAEPVELQLNLEEIG